MTKYRTISKIVPAKEPSGGAPIQRLIGTLDIDGKGTLHSLHQVDPFMLLDQGTIPKHDMPPFGAHPHRGHSVVTVLLRGSVKSWDSISQKTSTVTAPASYWVDAGSGVFHDESSVISDESDPKQHMSIFQLWVSVKQEDRTKKPRIQYHKNIAAVDAKDPDNNVVGSIRYFVGGSDSQIETLHPITVAHVSQLPGTTLLLDIPSDQHGFIVNLSGSSFLDTHPTAPATFAGTTTPTKENDVLVLTEDENADVLQVTTADTAGSDYLVCYGTPHKEPWFKKLVANGAVIAGTEQEARDIAKQVEGYSKTGLAGGSFSPFSS